MFNDLEQRILSISKKKGLTHISSCLVTVNYLDYIYQTKMPGDKVVLSNGHAGLALYVVLEKYEGKNAEKLYDKHGTHPNRDLKDGIWCSTGSLGQGLPIALGMALSDPKHDVYCVTSDGEWAEGSMWESLTIAAENLVSNLIILVISNGFSGYKTVDQDRLEWKIAAFVREKYPKVSFIRVENPEGYEGLDGHYRKVT
jgi:transketolase